MGSFRRRLISFEGYKGFMKLLEPDEILVIEYEDDKFDKTAFKQIKTAYEFKIVDRIDGNDLHGIWAWKKIDWEMCRGKPDVTSLYEAAFTIKSAAHRFVEDVALIAAETGEDAFELFEGTVAERFSQEFIKSHINFEE